MYNKSRGDLKKDIVFMLNENLSKKIVFHNSKNTLELYHDVQKLAKYEFLKKNQISMLKAAALFKNIGLINYKDPDNYNFFQNISISILGSRKNLHYQRESINIASEELPNYHFGPYEINVINDLILGTMREIGPKTHLGIILCDADLAYLAKDNFLERANLFREELDNLDRVVYSDARWYDREIEFFKDHEYSLSSSKRLFEEGKSRNLELLIKLRKNCRVNQYDR